MKSLFFFTLILVYAVQAAYAQPVPAKYGKVDLADLEMKVYDKDTTAEAVILCDFGVYNTNTFEFIRFLRIKILKKEGYNIVNRTFYISGTGAIKGCTYNLENGVVVESKLKNESIFKEQVYGDRYRYRVTMPDIKVGSVVDISYSFPLLPDEWHFQDQVPVRWSELRIPESAYVTFQKVFYGFEPLFINESNRWVGKDMPAMRPEPYVNSIDNYLTKFEFELSSVTVPGYMRFYTTSWNAVNMYLMDNDHFGQTYKMVTFLGDDVRMLQGKKLQGISLMKAACDAVKKHIKWNDDESLYTSGDLGMAFKKGSGNSADINLTLVSLLKKLDFDAFPIALSTRSNGIISPSYPTIDKFNYVIAGVRFNDKVYFYDATEPNLPSGMLPFRALNGRGRIIKLEGSDWVDLSPGCDQKESVFCKMKIDEYGEITGTISYSDVDYEGYYSRNNYKGYNSHDEYIKELESDFPGLTVNSSSFEDVDSIYKPLKENYDVTITGYSDIIGDMISIKPMLIEQMESNPFKLEKRKYPIDFGHPIRSRYILNLEIPQGYEITEVPKACNLALPDKGAKFSYAVTVNGNVVQLMANFEIIRTLFFESDYTLVKEFYNQVIAKQSEVIMLKKKI